MHDSSVWEKRWQALENMLNEMVDQYRGLPNPTLAALTGCLSAFGRDQFRFFHEGFEHERLLPSVQYPEEHVLRATLDQVAFDMSNIQRAASQRNQDSVSIQAALEKADRLAQAALDLATNSDLLPKSAVLTYFDKSPHIRVIPYAPVGFIGIPYTCVETGHDFLAIAHEAGHHVYHHAPGLAAHLHKQVSPQPEWRFHWLEEIFADVYGCLVAGPVIGLDFQDLLLDNPLDQFIADDGHHPIDAIRPYVYSKVLAELEYEHAPNVLNRRWEGWLTRRNSPTTFVLHGNSGEVSLEEARAKAEETAVNILRYLTEERGVKPTNTWSADLASSDEQAEELYKAFERALENLPNVTVYQLKELENHRVGVVAGDEQPNNTRAKGKTQTWRDWLKQESRTHKEHQLPAAMWMPVFTAGFWPIKGPEGNSNSGL